MTAIRWSPVVLGAAVITTGGGDLAAQWVSVQPGLEVLLGVPGEPRSGEDGSLVAVRADPRQFDVVVLSAATTEARTSLTADEWARKYGLVVVVNAGMYQEDGRTPVGYLRSDGRVVNRHWRKDYRTALVVGPDEPERPQVALLDASCDGPLRSAASGYRHVVQGIRMLTCLGDNVFRPGSGSATRLAVGMDGQERLLFVFHRTPVTGHDFVERVRAAGLDIRRLMYLEGGSEASLVVRGTGMALRFGGIGSSKIGRRLHLPDGAFLPVPNVIGLKPRYPDSRDGPASKKSPGR